MKLYVCRCCLLALLPAALNAQEVYRIIDAEGRVTYSSTPPANGSATTVEKVPIHPPPSATQRAEAEARLQAIQQASDRIAEQRQEEAAKRQEAIAQAEAALRGAQSELEEAKLRANEDLQQSVTGSSLDWPASLERIDRAKQRVEEAEQDLRRARASGGS